MLNSIWRLNDERGDWSSVMPKEIPVTLCHHNVMNFLSSAHAPACETQEAEKIAIACNMIGNNLKDYSIFRME